MNWRENSSQFFFEHAGFRLVAKPGMMDKGVQVFCNDKPFLVAFPIRHQDLREAPEPSYVRGQDLITGFFFNDNVVECYWRLVSQDSSMCVIESIFSIRSTLLTTGDISLESAIQFENANVEQEPGSFQYYDPASDAFAVLTTHPVDDDALRLSRHPDSLGIGIQLTEMERGVIRRLRCQLAVGSGRLDTQKILELENRFAISPLPLTT